MEFGCAYRNLTPHFPVWMGGYAARVRPSEGVTEPILVGVAAIRDGSATVALVSVDVVGIHTTEIRELKAALTQATGLREDHIVVACSHTHFGPLLSFGHFNVPEAGLVDADPRMWARFVSLTVEATTEAVGRLQPARMETLRTRAPQVMFNRRTVRPDGSVVTNFVHPPAPHDYRFSPVDDELVCQRFVASDGRILGSLVNFGCHPVTGGAEKEASYYQLSSDWVHYLRIGLEGQYGAPTLFSLGAAADVVPLRRQLDSRLQIGAILAGSVLLGERRFSPDTDQSVAAVGSEMEVTTIMEVEPAAAQTQYSAAAGSLLSVRAKNAASDSPEVVAAADDFHHALLRLLRARLYPRNRFTVPLQFLRVGDTRFSVLPFEVLAEFALKLKQEITGSALITCANGYQGYLPFRHEYDRGGYEATPWSTHFEVGTAERLYDASVAGLGRL